jgi:hypothetical protein
MGYVGVEGVTEGCGRCIADQQAWVSTDRRTGLMYAAATAASAQSSMEDGTGIGIGTGIARDFFIFFWGFQICSLNEDLIKPISAHRISMFPWRTVRSMLSIQTSWHASALPSLSHSMHGELS